MNDIPRNTGYDADGRAKTDADHYLKCPLCGGWIDMRDLGAVISHNGPLPHSQDDRLQ
jgi:hypothetical protein